LLNEKTKGRNPAVHIVPYGEGFLSKRSYFSNPDGGIACTRVVLTVGANVLITSEKETGINASGML
jgi:hypothetical protein